MTTDPEDGWGDLARELGLDPLPRQNPPAGKAAPPAPQPDAVGETGPAADGPPDLFQEFEPEGDFGDTEADLESEADDGSEEAADADGGTGAGDGEAGEDGPKKKRRRRRRRKKKGGEPSADGFAPATPTADDEDGDEPEVSAESDAADDDDGAEEEEDAAENGGPTAEASRELIANWDVPSWEQIVAGLYRPGGR